MNLFVNDEELPAELRDGTWWQRHKIGPTHKRETVRRENHPPVKAPFIPDLHYPRLPGYRQLAGQPPHYCRWMASMLGDTRYLYWYLPYAREYGIRVVDTDRPINQQSVKIRPIRFCPGCGDKLPASLRRRWRARVRAKGLSPEIPEQLPKALLTDDWWRAGGF